MKCKLFASVVGIRISNANLLLCQLMDHRIQSIHKSWIQNYYPNKSDDFFFHVYFSITSKYNMETDNFVLEKRKQKKQHRKRKKKLVST